MSTVLIVDDSYLNLKMMEEILRRNIDDIAFLEARNGQEALETIYEKEVDLVILDLNMPIMDGYDVLKELRKDSDYDNLPVIVNTSITQVEEIRRALALGAIDFFTKTRKDEEMEIIISTKVVNALKYYEQVNSIVTLHKLIDHDLNVASIIQRDFLRSRKDFSDMDIYVHFEPVKKLSGDAFTTYEKGDEKWLVLIDMKVPGMSSALLSLFFRELFLHEVEDAQSPAQLMQELNRKFIKCMSKVNYVFFSAMIAKIVGDKVIIANAGQPTEPYIFHKDQDKMEAVKANGRMIGVMEDSKYTDVEYNFYKGDCLIIYTDGIFSRFKPMDKDNIYGSFKNIYEIFKKEDLDSTKVTLNIYNEFLDKKNGINDDLTIACLRKI